MDRQSDILSAIDIGLDKLLAMKAREDFRLFYHYVFGQPMGPHHKEWAAMIATPPGVPGGGPHKRVLIQAPRGWAKTTFMVRYILWCLGHNPNLFVTYVTGDDDLAYSVGDEIGTHISSNEKLRAVFPHLREDRSRWAKSKRYVVRDIVSKDATLRCCGIFSTGAGGRSHLMVFDDVTSYRTSILQPSLREHVKKAFADTWMKFLLPGGVAIVIATPWGTEDLVAELAKNNAWAHWKKPCLDENGESTWPEVWSTEALLEQREIDKGSFERQMMLKPMSGAEGLFNVSTLEKCIVPYDEIQPGWVKYLGVDLAASLIGRGSMNALVLVAVDDYGRFHLDEAVEVRCDQVELIERIVDIYRRKHFMLAAVETNAYQMAIIPLIERMAPEIPVQGAYTTSSKFDLRSGIPGIQAAMRAGKWVIGLGPEHEEPGHTCGKCSLVEQLLAYPNSSRTDLIMAMWLATRARIMCEGELVDDGSEGVQADVLYASTKSERNSGVLRAIDMLDMTLEGDDYAELEIV